MKLTVVLLLVPICFAKLQVGKTVNIFNHFGNLDSFVKEGILENLPGTNGTTDILKMLMETKRDLNSEKFTSFDLRLCDNVEQLKDSLYRDSEVEGVEMIGKVFSGSRGRAATARSLGLNITGVLGDFSFVLVRLVKPQRQMKVIDPRASEQMFRRMDQVVPGDAETVQRVFREFGTHYISSYTTGDSLFQVFVFSPKVYQKLQETFQQYRESKVDFSQVLRFFNPLRSEFIGRIFSASGDTYLEHWAELNLLSFLPWFPAFPYSSLLHLQSYPYLLDEFTDVLDDDAILFVNMKTLADFFPEEQKRLWFEEVLSNQIQMWESNF